MSGNSINWSRDTFKLMSLAELNELIIVATEVITEKQRFPQPNEEIYQFIIRVDVDVVCGFNAYCEAVPVFHVTDKNLTELFEKSQVKMREILASDYFKDKEIPPYKKDRPLHTSEYIIRVPFTKSHHWTGGRHNTAIGITAKPVENHYDYLDRVMPEFLETMNVKGGCDANCGIVSTHGDKGYQYKDQWDHVGIPFNQAMALYLLSYCSPYSAQVRQTKNGWVDPFQWVIDTYPKYKHLLPA